MGEKNPDILRHKVRLTILLLSIAACAAITFYVGFIKGIAIIYTHLFYIPIILTGIWCYKKAVYVALGLGMLPILADYFSTHPFDISGLLRLAAFILIAYIIGFISKNRAKAEGDLRETKGFLENLIDYTGAPIIAWSQDNRVTKFNRAFEHLTGYTSEEVIGREMSMLFPESSREETFIKINRAMSSEYWESVEIPILCKNTETRYIVWNSANIYSEDNKNLLATIAQGVDITRRKETEEELKTANEEKGILLKEIHHRVKNNMQILTSLIDIQSARVEDKECQDIFIEMKNLIYTLMIVHEKLYQSSDLARIDFSEYMSDLMYYVFNSYNINGSEVRYKLDIRDIYLDIDTAIPCALIINELISNSLKHAFGNTESGMIEIAFYRDHDNNFFMEFIDNGAGLPDDIDLLSTSTFGMQIVTGLVKQLDGSIELDSCKGAKFIIRF